MLTRRTLLTRCGAALAAAYPFRVRAAVGPVMAALSTYMAAARERRLPAAALEATRHHILDTFAAMVSGADLLAGQKAHGFAREQAGRPDATVVATRVLTSPMDAALVNGVLAHSDETDDSHGESQSHPGAAVVPAALALGESLGVSGAHFLRAVALDYASQESSGFAVWERDVDHIEKAFVFGGMPARNGVTAAVEGGPWVAEQAFG